jgi:pyruvate,water dikinase
MNLLWLSQCECQDVGLVGGKVASLSRLAAEYRVPAGFCIPTTALDQWTEGSGIDVPHDSVRDALARAYARLAEQCGTQDPRVAVRSSAVDEDGHLASFAGQYDTYLNVSGIQPVLDAVGRCRASARSTRVLDYRRANGLPTNGRRLAVLVQQLVPSDVSAVIFTANPVSFDPGEIVINASWGLGESIVGGTVTPDTIVIRKSDIGIASYSIGDKGRMTVSVPGGTEEVDVPNFLRARAALDETQLREMAHLALSLEVRHQFPVDVECAYYDGQLYLLQCRPITTLAART